VIELALFVVAVALYVLVRLDVKRIERRRDSGPIRWRVL
jgi:hypothetical protein